MEVGRNVRMGMKLEVKKDKLKMHFVYEYDYNSTIGIKIVVKNTIIALVFLRDYRYPFLMIFATILKHCKTFPIFRLATFCVLIPHNSFWNKHQRFSIYIQCISYSEYSRKVLILYIF